jgi:uncharacterized membrane protein YfhO
MRFENGVQINTTAVRDVVRQLLSSFRNIIEIVVGLPVAVVRRSIAEDVRVTVVTAPSDAPAVTQTLTQCVQNGTVLAMLAKLDPASFNQTSLSLQSSSGNNNNNNDAQTSSSSNHTTLIIAIAASVGGLLLLAAAAILYSKHRKVDRRGTKRNTRVDYSVDNPVYADANNSSSSGGNKYDPFVVSDNQAGWQDSEREPDDMDV